MYQVKGKPWEYAGSVNVEDCKTAEDVITKANLDWEVSKCELVAKMPVHIDKADENGFIFRENNYVECPNAYATYRTDCNIPLGIVKNKYTPVQNISAFNFFNDAIGKNAAIWQTAGFFGNGERIFVSAKLPKNIFVNKDIVENYLVFTTSHDGTSGVKILFTPIRVVCQNTLNAAIKTATNYISFKHTSSISHKLNIAKEILGISIQKIDDFNENLNYLASQKIDDNLANMTFAQIVLTEDEILSIENTGHTINQIINKNFDAIDDSRISMRKVNTLYEMVQYYHIGVGQQDFLGTKYGVYNAINGYYSNVDNNSGTKRMDTLLYGDRAKKIELAGNLLMVA